MILRLLVWVLAGIVVNEWECAGGTWRDHFHKGLAVEWSGDNEDFQVTTNGFLEGRSVSPVGVSPLNYLELPWKLSNVVVSCWVNVVQPNSSVCTKGALFLRHDGTSGYIFALHQATQTIEVYRSFSGAMLLIKPAEIKLGQWYHLRAELNGTEMRFFVDGNFVGTVVDDESVSGKFGVAVQDADSALFDDFSLAGSEPAGNVEGIVLPEVKLEFAGEKGALRFAADGGYDYLVQMRSTPMGHDWQTITNFTVKVAPIEVEIPVGLGGNMTFYRVEKVDCWCD